MRGRSVIEINTLGTLAVQHCTGCVATGHESPYPPPGQSLHRGEFRHGAGCLSLPCAKTNLGCVIHKSLVYHRLETRLCALRQSGCASLSPQKMHSYQRSPSALSGDWTGGGQFLRDHDYLFKSDPEATYMQHCAFIFACVKSSGRPDNCDSLSHIVYIKTPLRKAFIFSPSWWFRLLFCLTSISVTQKQQVWVSGSFKVHLTNKSDVNL